MRQIDELHLEHPFAGSRMLRDFLQNNGVAVGRKHVASLMRRMGIEAIYQRPRTSTPHPGHKVFPYLLRNRQITAPNQVWAMDITYIRMRRGFVYLVAVLDWATRRVLSWRLSNSMTTDFCLEALEAAIRDYGIPEILNTDQGSQFTGTAFVDQVQQHGIRMGTLAGGQVIVIAIHQVALKTSPRPSSGAGQLLQVGQIRGFEKSGLFCVPRARTFFRAVSETRSSRRTRLRGGQWAEDDPSSPLTACLIRG